MRLVKNKHGIADIGIFGVNSQGTLGGYEIEGMLKIELNKGGWTGVYYYNDPGMAIPYNMGYYLHEQIPAYMCKRNGRWLVGTKKQLTNFINEL